MIRRQAEMIEEAGVLILEALPRDLVRKGLAYQPRFGGGLHLVAPFFPAVSIEKIFALTHIWVVEQTPTSLPNRPSWSRAGPQCRGANEKSSDHQCGPQNTAKRFIFVASS